MPCSKIRHLKIYPLLVSQGRLFQRTVCGSFLVESATYNRMYFLFTGRESKSKSKFSSIRKTSSAVKKVKGSSIRDGPLEKGMGWGRGAGGEVQKKYIHAREN